MGALRWSRRVWLQYAAAGFARPARAQTPSRPALDHLLLGIADLDRGIAWVEKTTGVKPAAGGSHPGAGTRNALVALGGRQYLEIIAPDPAQSSYNFQIDIRTLSIPRLITWAAPAADIAALANRARAAGHQVFGPRDGSRHTPDGQTLRWKTMGVLNGFGMAGVEPVPFFIEWAPDSAHPSGAAPSGCRLASFEIEHPAAAEISKLFAELGINALVKRGKAARLQAILDTPNGKVALI
jgi:hypothetical protein